eukprot:403342153
MNIRVVVCLKILYFKYSQVIKAEIMQTEFLGIMSIIRIQKWVSERGILNEQCKNHYNKQQPKFLSEMQAKRMMLLMTQDHRTVIVFYKSNKQKVQNYYPPVMNYQFMYILYAMNYVFKQTRNFTVLVQNRNMSTTYKPGGVVIFGSQSMKFFQTKYYSVIFK